MARITKLELQQQLALLAEENRALRERLSAMELDLEIARKAAPTPDACPPWEGPDLIVPTAHAAPHPKNFSSYYEYVGACRAHAKRCRISIVTYKSRAQFDELRAH